MNHTHYRVQVEAMFLTEKLGMEFNLPYSKELGEALKIVSEACYQEVNRIKKCHRDEFILQSYVKLKKAIASPLECRDILREICEYIENERN